MTSPITRLFNVSVTITRPTLTASSAGASTSTLAAVGTHRAALQPASMREVESAAQREIVFSHWLYTLPDADIQRGDHFEHGGLDYRVIEVKDAAGRNHHLEVMCAREVD